MAGWSVAGYLPWPKCRRPSRARSFPLWVDTSCVVVLKSGGGCRFY